MQKIVFLFSLFFSLNVLGDRVKEPTENKEIELPFTQQSVGGTIIKNAWVRATNGRNAAVFMVLENTEGDQLLKVEADVADLVELHTHVHEGDVVRMRAVDTLPIKDTVVLKPGGLHIMLIDLHHPLKEGDTISVKLMFEKSGSIVLDIPVLLRSPYTRKNI